MKEPRKRKRSLADTAKEAVLMFACDPSGWFCVFLVFGKSPKAGFAFLAAYAYLHERWIVVTFAAALIIAGSIIVIAALVLLRRAMNGI
jgi:hypothetical protein